MPRIRTIKPEFWTDDTVTECSLSARLLFIGMWNFADDAGNLDRSARQIKARVFPVDNIDCEPLIRELLTHGLLTEYSVNEKKYLHIPGFTEHQIINRPSKPSVPEYDDSLRTHGVLTEPSVTTHAGRKEGKERKEGAADAVLLEGVNPEAWNLWVSYRRQAGKPLKPPSFPGQQKKLLAFGVNQLAVVQQSIDENWQGLFPLKGSPVTASRSMVAGMEVEWVR